MEQLGIERIKFYIIMDIETIKLKAKKQVATNHGFTPIIGNEWESAMMLTHRTKRQLALYEEVLDLVCEALKKFNDNSVP